MTNFYTLLGVERNASKEEINKAFKQKAKEHHPDKHGNSAPASELFQLLVEAKEVLLDDAKRLAYDIKMGFRPDPKAQQSSSSGQKKPVFEMVAAFVAGALAVKLAGKNPAVSFAVIVFLVVLAIVTMQSPKTASANVG